MSQYSILRPPNGEEYCLTSDVPAEMANPARPARGKAMDGSYRDPVDFKMSDLVKGIVVPDVIANAFKYLMVSEAVEKLLRLHVDTGVEYLPFRLLNHKGRVAAERCFIVNVIGTIDCGNPAQSEGIPYPGKPGQFFTVERLGIYEDKVPPELGMFRVGSFPGLIFLSNKLRAELEKHKLLARFILPGEPLA